MFTVNLTFNRTVDASVRSLLYKSKIQQSFVGKQSDLGGFSLVSHAGNKSRSFLFKSQIRLSCLFFSDCRGTSIMVQGCAFLALYFTNSSLVTCQ